MTSEVTPELFASVPDQDGRFGRFGGKFVAETLMSALADLEQLYARLKDDAAFQREFDEDHRRSVQNRAETGLRVEQGRLATTTPHDE